MSSTTNAIRRFKNSLLPEWRRQAFVTSVGLSDSFPQPQRGRPNTRLVPRPNLRSRYAYLPGLHSVPVHSVLLGGQNGLSAQATARAVGDVMYGSRRVSDGPHARLLAAADGGPPPSSADILESDYVALAIAVIRATGDFFGATTAQDVVQVAMDFVGETLGTSSGRRTSTRGRSATGAPITVARVSGSRCHQVIDGHHRVAAAAHRGEANVTARVARLASETPLQSHLRRMSWMDGERRLYQPIDAPELGAWITVRRCDDRLEKMLRLLAELSVGRGTYLDVASCYGWFVGAFSARGWAAEGVERDPLAQPLGMAAYGLKQDAIHVADAVSWVEVTSRRWDVVSCFSLIHHILRASGRSALQQFLRALDKITARVLFIDSGETHEQWFAQSLPGWDAPSIQAFLQQHTSFRHVINLGPDADGVGPYAGNYGRHLFACVRDGTALASDG